DYEMDPDVVNDPAYRGVIIDALKAIPTMALACAREDLDTFYWGSGESCISMELIHPDEPWKNVQTDCGAEPHSHNRMKRSLRLNFRAEFGDARLESSFLRDGPLNGDSAADSFDKLILRGGNNRSWARVWNPERTTYTMDQWYRDTQIVMSGVGSHGTFVHLYINGLYWGLYNVVERPDAAFAASYLGGEAEDWYSVSHGGSHGGDPARWNYLKGALKNKEMSDPDNYAEMEDYLDIDAFIDYVMLSWFVGMTDWPQNNWWGGNRNDVPLPFLYFGWDAEWSWKTTRGHNNGWVHPDFRENKSGGDTIAALWHSLRRNGDFMMRFADRAYEHLSHDGALSDDICKARYLVLNDFIRDAVVAESARWGDTCEGLGQATRTRNVDWLFAEAEMLGPGFMDGNAARFVVSLRDEGYYPDIDPPVLTPRGGQVSAEYALALANPNDAGVIYYTLDGSDPRCGVPAVSETTVTLIAEDADKKARVPTGPIDEAWQGGRDFDDSAWIQVAGAPGGIGYEANTGYEDLISLDLERRMYRYNPGCYVRIPFVAPEATGSFNLMTLRARYDDGFVAYLNGVEICRANVSGELTWDTPAGSSHADGDAIVFQDFDVSQYLDVLISGENVLALHGLNSSIDSSDFLLSVELIAGVRSAAETGVAPTALLYDGPVPLDASAVVWTRVLGPQGWSALEKATFAVGPVADDLRITEIMFHPRDPNAEYIELKNLGAGTLNLNLVAFTKGVGFVFGDVPLGAGEHVLAVRDMAAFERQYGAGHNVAGQYRGSLDNGGERLRLVDAAGAVIHDFTYDDDWYPPADGDGFSLVVIDPAADPNEWGDRRLWRASKAMYGSPGADD
ncbi:MAG: CotH kinase family protein, partial [Sedimentisphaerales bacterium]|nr:CotH kinase family protein [Sedimentisphaerales bacterium]